MHDNELPHDADSSTVQLCTFRLAGRLFGVDILDVKEVTDVTEITPIAHAPAAVRGYMNIRGQIHLVVDLRIVFGFGREGERRGRVVLFKSSVDDPFGILVDEVADVVTVDRGRIEDRRGKADASVADGGEERRRAATALSHGVCKLEDRLLVVLNARGTLAGIRDHTL